MLAAISLRDGSGGCRFPSSGAKRRDSRWIRVERQAIARPETRGGEPMGDLDRQRRLADAANALERRVLSLHARLFARSSDHGRLEDLLGVSAEPSSIAYLSALNTAVSALAGRRSSRNSAESLGAVVAQIPFSPQIVRQLAAVSCKYHHDLFVKPDIHRGGIIGIAIVVKLLCEFLTRKETAVYGQRDPSDRRRSVSNRASECLQSSFSVFCRSRRRALRRHPLMAPAAPTMKSERGRMALRSSSR